MKIVYDPVSANLQQPSDRRRFCAYAARRSRAFSTDGNAGADADVLVLSEGADLSRWVAAGKGRAKIVFDFIDSYLAEDAWSWRRNLRGVAKFAVRRTRRLHLSYRQLLIDTCRLADAVVCATEEQKKAISAYCPNVHVILDFQEADVWSIKSDYRRRPCFNLVWEGLPGNLTTFRPLVPALRQLQARQPLALHLITTLQYPLGLGTLLPRPTQRLAVRVFEGLKNVHLYDWNSLTLSPLAAACDLAVIPIPLEIGMMAGKPANKLHSFWRMALPVLTSATPAYLSSMRGAGLAMACSQPEEWLAKLEYYMGNEGARRDAGQQGKRYADAMYGDEAMASRWDGVFASIGFPLGSNPAKK